MTGVNYIKDEYSSKNTTILLDESYFTKTVAFISENS
jgi:hypothetical protein